MLRTLCYADQDRTSVATTRTLRTDCKGTHRHGGTDCRRTTRDTLKKLGVDITKITIKTRHMTTTKQHLETTIEVELDLHLYTIIAEVLIEYDQVDVADEHPYGNSTATQYYTELDIDSIEIQEWYRDFGDEIGVWIPEHLTKYDKETGLES